MSRKYRNLSSNFFSLFKKKKKVIEIGSPETTRWYLKKKKIGDKIILNLIYLKKEMFQKNLQVCIFASYLFEPEREE